MKGKQFILDVRVKESFGSDGVLQFIRESLADFDSTATVRLYQPAPDFRPVTELEELTLP